MKVLLQYNFPSIFLRRKKQSSKFGIYTHFSKVCENSLSQKMELALSKYSVFLIPPGHPEGLEIIHISKIKVAYFHKLQIKSLQSPSIKIYKRVKAL